MENKIDLIKKNRKKDMLIYFLTIFLSLTFIIVGNKVIFKDLTIFEKNQSAQNIVKVKIVEIVDRKVDKYVLYDNESYDDINITFKGEILKGEGKGETLLGAQLLDASLQKKGISEVKVNDVVLLAESFPGTIDSSAGLGNADMPKWQFAQHVRTDKLFIFVGLFMIALLVFGKMKGLNTLISLAFTCIAIFAVFIPSILAGKNIYLSTMVLCLYTIIMTYLLVNGYNRKTLAAILGCFGGVALSGLLTVIMSKTLALTGLVDEDSLYLTFIETETPIDLKAIIFAAILIGALGAIMDVAMSIASSLWEIKEKAPDIERNSMFKAGINIGRDLMGTMTNTLILAYIGSALSTVLLLIVYNPSIIYLLNREMIVVELLQAIIGSFGLLLTLPLTSIISAVSFTSLGAKNYNIISEEQGEVFKEINPEKTAKEILREELKNIRLNLDNDYKKTADTAIFEKIVKTKEYLSAKNIFCYISTDEEPNTFCLIEDALKRGKTVLVPKITGKGKMEACEIKNFQDLKEGKFGILEPSLDVEIFPKNKIWLSIVPCLGADCNGHRIGHGGGYYDRYLKDANSLNFLVCYEKLLTSNIDAEDHDVPCDFLVTEDRVMNIYNH